MVPVNSTGYFCNGLCNMETTTKPPQSARHGLVIGKFLPFHNGHKRLIEHAAARCDTLTVAVFSRDCEPIPGEMRAGWIRKELPSVRVVHRVANYPDPWDEESWHYWVAQCLDCAPGTNVLFTGEAYGNELARRMGISHECVDRTLDPISGTAIRSDPISFWKHVPKSVRPYLARKVAIVGAESSGKTTLAGALAEHYETAWVPEFGREYCEVNDIHSLTPDDLLAIAIGQCELEDRMAAECSGLLICDTDLMVTRAWCMHLCEEVHPGIAELERSRSYDLHLVTNDKVGWVNDGTRVCSESAVRQWFQTQFLQELGKAQKPHMVLPARQGDAFMLACNAFETLWPALRKAAKQPGHDPQAVRSDLGFG
jgi:HTH-type transcriptional regulator, transcriptional repressor of NAD biosynthesis genes